MRAVYFGRIRDDRKRDDTKRDGWTCGLHKWARLGAAFVFATFSPASQAAAVDWLYEVDVPVVDQSADERATGVRAALVTLLTRVTGDSDVARGEAVVQALRSPERYFLGYAYRPGTEPDSPLWLRVSFSPNTIRQLIDTAGLPMLSRSRPTTLVWLAIDAGGERRVLGASDGLSVGEALLERAMERGLIVMLPLMDPESVPEIATDAVWNRRWEKLFEASRPYNTQSVLVGKITQSSTGGWLADWTYRIGPYGAAVAPMTASTLTGQDPVASATSSTLPAERQITLETDSAELAAVAGIDLIADELFARYAVPPGPTTDIAVEVGQVSDIESYAALLQYLATLDYVDAVQVDVVTRDLVKLRLFTRTRWAQLRDLLALDGRLAPVESESIDGGADFGAERLTWFKPDS